MHPRELHELGRALVRFEQGDSHGAVGVHVIRVHPPARLARALRRLARPWESRIAIRWVIDARGVGSITRGDARKACVFSVFLLPALFVRVSWVIVARLLKTRRQLRAAAQSSFPEHGVCETAREVASGLLTLGTDRIDPQIVISVAHALDVI